MRALPGSVLPPLCGEIGFGWAMPFCTILLTRKSFAILRVFVSSWRDFLVAVGCSVFICGFVHTLQEQIQFV